MLPGLKLDHSVIAVSDWEVSNAFYRDVVGAELVAGGPGRTAYRLGDTQLNVHGPGVDVGDNVARLPVQPGNSDLCFVWPGPIEEAIDHLQRHEIEIETGPIAGSAPRARARASTSATPTAACSSSSPTRRDQIASKLRIASCASADEM